MKWCFIGFVATLAVLCVVDGLMMVMDDGR
mgnify:FL=1